MSPAGARKDRRPLRRSIIALAGLAIISTSVALPFAGRFLAQQDPLERADAIVVLAGARAERWLEAVDLYREGWAPRIVLSPGRIEPAEEELRRRGIAFPPAVDAIRAAIVQLGVPADAVRVIPGSVDNTAQEAAATRHVAVAAGWRRVLVVTSEYHGRRARFAFRRELAGTSVHVTVRTSRYDPSTPERWWRSRADVRWVLSEMQKLVAYRLGLGG